MLIDRFVMLQIYLVIDEEKKGPYTLFQVEEQLRDGTFEGDHLAWYDGVGEWAPLRDLPPFESFFRRRDAELEDERRVKAAERVAELQRERTESLPKSDVRPWTRFWARNLDWWFFFVLCLMVMVGMRAMGWVNTNIADFMVVVPMLMPVMHLIEAYCIDRWGTTPGKALVGIHITDAEGNALDFGASLRRSLGVFVLAMGCYIGPLSLFTLPFAYYLLKKNRRSFWDMSTGSFVHHAPFQAKHVFIPLAIMFGFMIILHKPLKEASDYQTERYQKAFEVIRGGENTGEL